MSASISDGSLVPLSRRVIPAALFIYTPLSRKNAEVAMTTDEQAIRDLVATWMKASQAGDTETVLTLMSEDVVFLLPGQPPMRGRAGFAAASAKIKDTPFKLETDSEIVEIKVLGDWAYIWTKLGVTMTPANAAPIKRRGNTLSILKKENGKWVFFRDANMLTVVEK
jgi:uncharacterized protein (TIGR02246 family)